MAETRQSRRPKRPQPSRDDDGSPPRGGGGGSKGGKAAPVRTGKANKKRDDRSALVEAWMLKNENTSEKPSNEVKARYADELKIPKEEFWNTMKKYALLSKYNCLPDFDQIFHHIKDNSKVDLGDLKVGQLDYWWEVDDDEGCYRPITANLKNFKPASGLLHHFYTVFVEDPKRYKALTKLPSQRCKYQPDELEELVKKLTPFREVPEPKALLVVPKTMPQLRGTYALSKKIAGNNVYLRPERKITRGPERLSVVVNGTKLEVPISKTVNYATTENGLVLYCKDEKKEGGGGGDDGAETYQHIPLRLKVPGSSGPPVEATVPSLHDSCYELDEATVWPVRGLIPPHRIAAQLDYGAVWNGCFSPFPRTSVSYEEFAVQLDPHLPAHCIRYFFFFDAGEAGGSSESVSSEDYIRFMTWFANYEEGLGQDNRNVLALYDALAAEDEKDEHLPFAIQSQGEALRASQRTGALVVRLCHTKPGYLTLEVLKEEDEGSPFAVLCFRVKVDFLHPRTTSGGGKDFFSAAPRATVAFSLEAPEGGTLITQEGRLTGPLLEKVHELSALPSGVKLQPLPSKLMRPSSTATGGRRLGAGGGDEALPPPISRLGASGIPHFNDPSFDMDGRQQLAASLVEREPSHTHVPVKPEAAAAGAGGLQQVWGHRIPLPAEGTIARGHSLSPFPHPATPIATTAAGGGGSLGLPPPPVERDLSLGSLFRDSSLGGLMVERDHSLSLLPPMDVGGGGGVGRDTSLGSLLRGVSFNLPSDDSEGGHMTMMPISSPPPAHDDSRPHGGSTTTTTTHHREAPASAEEQDQPPAKRLRSAVTASSS